MAASASARKRRRVAGSARWSSGEMISRSERPARRPRTTRRAHLSVDENLWEGARSSAAATTTGTTTRTRTTTTQRRSCRCAGTRPRLPRKRKRKRRRRRRRRRRRKWTRTVECGSRAIAGGPQEEKEEGEAAGTIVFSTAAVQLWRRW